MNRIRYVGAGFDSIMGVSFVMEITIIVFKVAVGKKYIIYLFLYVILQVLLSACCT